jgi:hypothetical protein
MAVHDLCKVRCGITHRHQRFRDAPQDIGASIFKADAAV